MTADQATTTLPNPAPPAEAEQAPPREPCELADHVALVSSFAEWLRDQGYVLSPHPDAAIVGRFFAGREPTRHRRGRRALLRWLRGLPEEAA